MSYTVVVKGLMEFISKMVIRVSIKQNVFVECVSNSVKVSEIHVSLAPLDPPLIRLDFELGNSRI